MAHLVQGESIVSQGSVLDGVDWGLTPNPLSIVLTNECDLLNDKASFIIVAALVEAKETITQSKEYKSQLGNVDGNEIGNDKWKKLKSFLEKYIYNTGITRYFFIDPSDAIDAPYLLVDFQHIQSIPIEYSRDLEVVAALPSPFKEQMMVQFASYTARVPVNRANDVSPIVDNLIEPLRRKQ